MLKYIDRMVIKHSHMASFSNSTILIPFLIRLENGDKPTTRWGNYVTIPSKYSYQPSSLTIGIGVDMQWQNYSKYDGYEINDVLNKVQPVLGK